MARRVADAGYALFPGVVTLDERGKKKPVIPGYWQAESTFHPEDNGQWDRGLVIDTGKSGIVVIALDEHGDVSANLALEQAGIESPPSSMIVKTWSGGLHLFF